MKVILIKDVTALGRAGDIKEVSDGHARNFLIPRGLGLPATSEMLAKIQKEKSEHQKKVAKENERFLQLKNKFQNKTFSIKAKANKKSLFAAIHEKEIAKVISEKTGTEITPEMVQIKSQVKTLGQHEIELRFAKNLSAMVILNVEQV